MKKTPDKASHLENQQILDKEGTRILSKINDKEFVIALAIEGQQFPSEEFSKRLSDVTVRGFSDITFVIGGSLGLSTAVKKRANLLMSFGKLTLPHQLMRLVLVEQIYRSFMIQQGSPYHK
ncbi:23S rRNA (pseudouridine(1915)-N(3))-methyltransferase RlmH [Streptococcus anginosus]|nr:23S rRNA (pseudouridine(1915)-N(3))-methyltransferase RlmH [Streptococcus anginosus]